MKVVPMPKVLLAVAFLLAACATSEPLSEGLDRDLPTTEEVAAQASEPEDIEPTTEAPDPSEVGSTYKVTGRQKSSGLQVAITEMRFITRAEADALLGADAEHIVDDNTSTIVIATMRVANDSGSTIDFYPNQGTLQIGREQRDADLFMSSDELGGTFNDGVDEIGQIMWQFRTAPERLMKAGAARFTKSAAHDSETYDSVGKDIDITVKW